MTSTQHKGSTEMRYGSGVRRKYFSRLALLGLLLLAIVVALVKAVYFEQPATAPGEPAGQLVTQDERPEDARDEREPASQLDRAQPEGLSRITSAPAETTGVIVGYVMDITGHPCANALVAAASMRRPVLSLTNWPGEQAIVIDRSVDLSTSDALCRSANDGSFHLEGLAPGSSYTLSATDTNSGGMGIEQAVAVPEINTLTPTGEVVIVIRRAGIVSGVLAAVDGDDVPVCQIVVAASGLAGARVATGISDTAGRFRVVGVPVGEVTVMAHSDGFASKDVTVIQVSPGTEISDINLVLERTYDTFGVVLDDDGNGVVGAQLELMEAADEAPGSMGVRLSYCASTGAGGRFSFAAIPTGSYRCRVSAPTFLIKYLDDVMVPAEDVVVVLDRAREVSIQALDAETSEPVPLERIDIMARKLTNSNVSEGFDNPYPWCERVGDKSDASTWKVRLSEKGSYQAVGWSRQHGVGCSTTFTVNDGPEEIVVRVLLRRGLQIVAQVKDGTSGEPIDGVGIVAQIQDVGEPAYAYPVAGATGSDGSVVLDGVAPGRNTFVVNKPGYSTAMSDHVLSADTGIVVLSISREASLFGRLTTAHGTPIAFARIEARSELGVEFESQTDNGGFYRIASMDAGKYLVYHDAGQEVTASLGEGVCVIVGESDSTLFDDDSPMVVSIGAGESREVNLVGVVGKGVIRGMVLINDQPASGVQIDLCTIVVVGTETHLRVVSTARSHRTGAYWYMGVPEGHYTMMVRTPGRTHYEAASVSVLEGQSQWVSLSVRVVRLEGHVTSKSGPVSGAFVTASRGGTASERSIVRTDGRGFFAFEELQAGEYELVVDAVGFVRTSVGPIKIGEGAINADISVAAGGWVEVRVEGGDEVVGGVRFAVQDSQGAWSPIRSKRRGGSYWLRAEGLEVRKVRVEAVDSERKKRVGDVVFLASVDGIIEAVATLR